MPRNPKIFYHNSVHFITTSVEEGFMFPPNPLVNEIIKKCLAQAQKLHPVHISDLLVEATHTHFIMQVIDPKDAADFMERFKTESAHAINRLLGRKKRTLWCEGYDSPLIEDIETLITKIAYIYENPSKDELSDCIDRYPGFNTFSLRRDAARKEEKAPDKSEYETYYIPRSQFKPLGDTTTWSEGDYRRERQRIIHKMKKNYLKIEPNCWMLVFGKNTPEEQRQVNAQIVAELREREGKHRKARLAEGKTPMKRKQLVDCPIGGAYTPKRRGWRMITHSVCKEIRKQTIKWAKALFAAGRRCLERWRQGDMTAKYPLGLFPPTGIRLAEPIGW